MGNPKVMSLRSQDLPLRLQDPKIESKYNNPSFDYSSCATFTFSIFPGRFSIYGRLLATLNAHVTFGTVKGYKDEQ